SAAVVVSEPGFTVTTFSISTVSGIISGLAPSPGGEFGSDLYVALGLGSIVRVDPSSGSVTPFATGLTNIDGLAFDPGTFETGLLYVSRNDGSISTVSAARVVSLFTKGGTLNSSNDLVFAPPGSAFGTDLFVSNGSFGAGETISKVSSDKTNS